MNEGMSICLKVQQSDLFQNTHSPVASFSAMGKCWVKSASKWNTCSVASFSRKSDTGCSIPMILKCLSHTETCFFFFYTMFHGVSSWQMEHFLVAV